MLVVRTACATKREAEKIAATLVKERLAACASVFPCRSFFYWERKLQKRREFALELKIKSSNYPELEKRIRQLHSYELPSIIAFKPAKAYAGYRDWVEK